MSKANKTYLNRPNDSKSSKPYCRVYAGPQRDEYIHRMIMSALVRRELLKEETVHHRNLNTLDNHPCNLVLIWTRDHPQVTSQNGSLEGIEILADGADIWEETRRLQKYLML
jgi:hypothetical protein